MTSFDISKELRLKPDREPNPTLVQWANVVIEHVAGNKTRPMTITTVGGRWGETTAGADEGGRQLFNHATCSVPPGVKSPELIPYLNALVRTAEREGLAKRVMRGPNVDIVFGSPAGGP